MVRAHPDVNRIATDIADLLRAGIIRKIISKF